MNTTEKTQKKAFLENVLILTLLAIISIAAHNLWEKLIKYLLNFSATKYIFPWMIIVSILLLIIWFLKFIPKYKNTQKSLKLTSLSTTEIAIAILIYPCYYSVVTFAKPVLNKTITDPTQILVLFVSEILLAFPLFTKLWCDKTKQSSKTSNDNSTLLDEPCQNMETDDLLDRKGIVEELQAILQNHAEKKNRSQTIGLYGSWGSGKTTVINFLKNKLDTEKETSGKYIFFDFSPWFFSSSDSIEKAFFIGLKAELKKHYVLPCTFKAAISNFAPLLSGTPGLGSCIESLWSNINTPEAIKDTLEEFIARINKHLVIIIDDIDRLNKEEILDVFKIVKLASNFKNTTHILCMDKESCLNILSEHNKYSIPHWEIYVEKIIQRNFHLPLNTAEFLKQEAEQLHELASKSENTNYFEPLSDFASIYNNLLNNKTRPYIDILQTTRKTKTTLQTLLAHQNTANNSVTNYLVAYLQTHYNDVYSLVSQNNSLFINKHKPAYPKPHSDNSTLEKLIEMLTPESTTALFCLFPAFTFTYYFWYSHAEYKNKTDKKTLPPMWENAQKCDIEHCQMTAEIISNCMLSEGHTISITDYETFAQYFTGNTNLLNELRKIIPTDESTTNLTKPIKTLLLEHIKTHKNLPINDLAIDKQIRSAYLIEALCLMEKDKEVATNTAEIALLIFLILQDYTNAEYIPMLDTALKDSSCPLFANITSLMLTYFAIDVKMSFYEDKNKEIFTNFTQKTLERIKGETGNEWNVFIEQFKKKTTNYMGYHLLSTFNDDRNLQRILLLNSQNHQ